MGHGSWLQRNVNHWLPAEGRQYPLRRSGGDIWKFSGWALNEDRSGMLGCWPKLWEEHQIPSQVTPRGCNFRRADKTLWAYVFLCTKGKAYLPIWKRIRYLHKFAHGSSFSLFSFLFLGPPTFSFSSSHNSVVTLSIFHQLPIRGSFSPLPSLWCFLHALAIAVTSVLLLTIYLPPQLDWQALLGKIYV